MGTPTRYPFGVTNVTKQNPLGAYVQTDPTKVHQYWNDFDTYAAGDWVITDQGTGTVALADGDGGLLSVATDVLDNDNTFVQKVGESFLLASGKKAWFKTRFKVSNATETDLVLGLQVTDTSPLDVVDGIYFLKPDDTTTVSIVERKNATTGSQTETVTTLVNNSYVSLAWYYDGKQTINYYVDDVQVGSLDSADSFLPDQELTVSFGIQAGSAGAKTLTIDYIFAAKER